MTPISGGGRKLFHSLDPRFMRRFADPTWPRARLGKTLIIHHLSTDGETTINPEFPDKAARYLTSSKFQQSFARGMERLWLFREIQSHKTILRRGEEA